ncbi:hypothetical protein VKT23_006585 [Stygiomarasmius scandens]|uniref:Uncharacterized protein n=1 Tax=Marasmiellus scandens TaxID=2682957 RepID=A0ABR1JP35_9AGAR
MNVAIPSHALTRNRTKVYCQADALLFVLSQHFSRVPNLGYQREEVGTSGVIPWLLIFLSQLPPDVTNGTCLAYSDTLAAPLYRSSDPQIRYDDVGPLSNLAHRHIYPVRQKRSATSRHYQRTTHSFVAGCAGGSDEGSLSALTYSLVLVLMPPIDLCRVYRVLLELIFQALNVAPIQALPVGSPNMESAVDHPSSLTANLASTSPAPPLDGALGDVMSKTQAHAWPVEYSPVEYGPVEYSPVEYGPVEYGPVEYGPVEYGPVEYGPVEYGPVEYGPNHTFDEVSVDHPNYFDADFSIGDGADPVSGSYNAASDGVPGDLSTGDVWGSALLCLQLYTCYDSTLAPPECTGPRHIGLTPEPLTYNHHLLCLAHLAPHFYVPPPAAFSLADCPTITL